MIEELCQAVRSFCTSQPFDIPPVGENVWDWFWQLDRGRSVAMEVNRLSWQDISSWQNVTGIYLAVWELRAIQLMDTYRLDPDYDPAPPKPVSVLASLKALQDSKAK